MAEQVSPRMLKMYYYFLSDYSLHPDKVKKNSTIHVLCGTVSDRIGPRASKIACLLLLIFFVLVIYLQNAQPLYCPLE